MFEGIDHVIIFVNDLERAKVFYHETLGLPLLLDSPGFVGVDLGGTWLGLHPTEASGEDVGKGPLAYLRVDDIQAVVTELRQRGITIHREISEVPGGSKIATIHDSEGNGLGLFQRTN